MKFNNVLFSDTVYTLLLYTLFFYEKIDDTLFIFSDGVPKKVRDNFNGHIYLDSGCADKFPLITRLKSILKLRNLSLGKLNQFGQDHTFFSFPYLNDKFTLLEDGTANYQSILKPSTLQAVIKFIILGGSSFGFNKKVNKILLTSKNNWPKELVDKIEYKDIFFYWEKRSKTERKQIMSRFCLDFDLEDNCRILLTQYFSEHGLMTEEEKILMYKDILSKYKNSSAIYIKPHPKEKTDYSEFFENKIIPAEVPFQLIELSGSNVDSIITCTSSASLNTKAKIFYHEVKKP